MAKPKQSSQEPLPMVANCRQLDWVAPLRWLKLGLKDVFKAPLASLGLGFLMSGAIAVMALLAWRTGSGFILFCLLAGWVFAAPIACIGTYAISAQLERGPTVSVKRVVRACLQRYIGTILVYALVLLVIFLIWARASSMVSVFLPHSGDAQMAEMSVYFAVLTIISGIFLGIIYTASVFSLPMIMHRDVDAITAVITSINAVLRNKAVMALWAVLIALGIIAGLLTLGIGLIVILPAIGHAVWHGYLDTIDASPFPLHKLGITANG